MASYTDQILTFNPYIKQVDDTYAAVGMMKQQQYDQGVQKIQGYVDSVYGLDIDKEVEREYLDKRVNSLTSAINTQLKGADFSNQAIVNQVSGYAAGIANDEIIKTAITSTARMRADLATAATAKKEGKGYAPQNEAHLMKDVVKYKQSGLGEAYQSEGYIPYTDVDKRVVDLWSQMKPNSKIVKSWRPDGSEGFVENTVTGTKWISKDEVMSQISTTLDPASWKQLSIDAEYMYNGRDLNPIIDQTFNKQKKTLENEANQLTLMAMSTDDKEQAKVWMEQAKSYCDRVESINKEAEQLKEEAKTNPIGVGTKMYMQNWLDGTADKLSYTNETLENRVDWQYYNTLAKITAANNKAAAANKSITPDGFYVERPLTKEEIQGINYDNFVKGTEQMEKASEYDKKKALYETIHEPANMVGLGLTDDASANAVVTKTTVKNPNGTYEDIYTIKNQQKFDQLYNGLFKGWQKGAKVPMEIRNHFDAYRDGQLTIDKRKAAQVDADTEAEKALLSDPRYANLKELEAKPLPVGTMDIRSTKNGNTYKYTNDDLANYRGLNKQLAQLNKTSQGMTSEQIKNQRAELYKKYGYTDEKYDLLNASLREGDEVSARRYGAVDAKLNAVEDLAGPIMEKRRQLRNDAIGRYGGVFNPREKIINLNDPKSQQTFANVLGKVTSQYAQAGQDKFAGFDLNDVATAVDEDHRKSASVSYFIKDGQSYLSVSHKDFNDNKPMNVPIGPVLANQLKLYEFDYLNVHKTLMSLDKDRRTGSSVNDAVPVPRESGVLEKHTVGTQMKDLGNGTYKLSLYIDGNPVPWTSDEPLSEPQIIEILRERTNDSTIDAYLTPNSGATTPFGGPAIANGTPAIKMPSFTNASTVQLNAFGMPDINKVDTSLEDEEDLND